MTEIEKTTPFIRLLEAAVVLKLTRKNQHSKGEGVAKVNISFFEGIENNMLIQHC